ncbi:hypothetical protein Syun_001601 [Stephania yunnanensis]|uniref:Ribosome recycling factor domain-containing protein n=1 Tax=Stephania yunnanensis TaxID=152371 RepID=A0AAP0LE79_9MAGN
MPVSVVVEYYGTPVNLKSIAQISAPNASSLLIQPHDKSRKDSIAMTSSKQGYSTHPMNNVLTMPKGTILPANPNILEDTNDLVQLSFLNEPSVLHNLCCRYSQSKSDDAVGGQDGLNSTRALWPFIALNTAKFVIRFIKILQSRKKYQDLKLVKGAPTREPSNKLFWFTNPEWILLLIHFTLFQVKLLFITVKLLFILHTQECVGKAEGQGRIQVALALGYSPGQWPGKKELVMQINTTQTSRQAGCTEELVTQGKVNSKDNGRQIKFKSKWNGRCDEDHDRPAIDHYYLAQYLSSSRPDKEKIVDYL